MNTLDTKKEPTIFETLEQIRSLGLTASYRKLGSFSWEFRVNFTKYAGGTEGSAYYTENRQDAIDTAKLMAANKAKHGN